MPRSPSWYSRIPTVIATLEKITAPSWAITRVSIEKMLRVGPRRALQLMNTMPDVEIIGNMAFIEREHFLRWLRNVKTEAKTEIECRRREKTWRRLKALDEEVKGRSREIYDAKTLPAIQTVGLAELKKTTTLRPGELQIRFTGIQDLMQQLFQFAQALNNDYIAIDQLLSKPTTHVVSASDGSNAKR